jgi:hypothetical protein
MYVQFILKLKVIYHVRYSSSSGLYFVSCNGRLLIMVVFVVNLYISFFYNKSYEMCYGFQLDDVGDVCNTPVIASLIIFIKSLIKDQIP